MQWFLRCLVLVVFAGFVGGCAPSLNNMTQARVLQPGELQTSYGIQVEVYTQAIEGLVKAGKIAQEQIDNETGEISEETLERALDAALMFAFFPVSGSQEFSARAGLLHGFLNGVDVGIRYNGHVFKGDVRLGLLESANKRWAVTGQLGYGRHGAIAPGVLEWLALTRWSRHDFEFGLIAGWEYPDIFKTYIAPRVIVSTISSEPKISESLLERLPESIQKLDPHEYFPSSSMTYWGGNMGFMLGYKYVFLNVDIGLFKIDYEPVIFFEKERFRRLGCCTNDWFDGLFALRF